MIRVTLPTHLRTLAQVEGEIHLDVDPPVTLAAVLDALERRHPVLRGTMRDQATERRRPFVRFFAGEVDMSLEPPEALLPAPVARGRERFAVIGALAGG